MKITAVIPTFNEEETVAEVIAVARGERISGEQNAFQWLASLVSPGLEPLIAEEIIVVDDHSVDGTVARAKAAGANVIISAKRGKGASMREGLLVASGEIVVFLDADIPDYVPNVVDRLARPITGGRAGFVKGTFDRQAGRVAELVAKPPFGFLFPAAPRFSQPPSGMIAGRRDALPGVGFENH